MKQHYIIPIFIPEKACPFRCVYCNQYNITNQQNAIEPAEVKDIIEQYLATFPPFAQVKVGFFGGSFTGLSIEEQNRYLDVVQPYIECGQISGIQLSTRPDYINDEILHNLLVKHVVTIELGAQSLNDEVLRLSGRGHTAEEVEKAAKLIRSYGFMLGLQMMIGLPGDSAESALQTAQKIVELGATCTRIYPCLVIKDTDLEKQFKDGNYKPLSMEEAVSQTLDVMELFERNSIQILRVGLHPSEGLLNRETLVAGPFHVSFKELVLTEKWKRKILSQIKGKQGNNIQITVNPLQVNTVVGYQGANKSMLETLFKNVSISQDYAVPLDEMILIID